MSLSQQDKVAAVIVTHQRHEQLRQSLSAVVNQSSPVEWVIVVDNGAEPQVEEVVQEIAQHRGIYLPSKTNLGGAGGFALGFLTALSLGADAVWCADDDGYPVDNNVLGTLQQCAEDHDLDQVSPLVCVLEDPERLAFPLRQGLEWRRRREEIVIDDEHSNLLPGLSALFNGALFSAHAISRLGVPDYRLFIRGDEVEYHRRLRRSGLKFGTCLSTAYLHPDGCAELKPIMKGKLHALYPDNEAKRFFQYRNRGYLLNQPGMRKRIPQEYARFAWFFLAAQKDPRGFLEWVKLQNQGRKEHFNRPGE